MIRMCEKIWSGKCNELALNSELFFPAIFGSLAGGQQRVAVIGRGALRIASPAQLASQSIDSSISLHPPFVFSCPLCHLSRFLAASDAYFNLYML